MTLLIVLIDVFIDICSSLLIDIIDDDNIMEWKQKHLTMTSN